MKRFVRYLLLAFLLAVSAVTSALTPGQEQVLFGGVRPSLNLNFLNGVADSRITFSGGVNGTRVDSTGTIVAATAPRFDYDPVSLAPKGLLSEEARTNLLLRSAEFDNASWSKANGTVTANVTASPDGATTADKLIEDGTAGAEHLTLQGASITSGTVYTFTVFAKAAERTSVTIRFAAAGYGTAQAARFNLSTQQIATISGTPTTSITAYANGWYRLQMTATATATTTANHNILLSTGSTETYNGDNASGLYLWGADLQAGSFVTSHIPTTSAAVTRTADSAVMTGANFSSWYRQDQGTFVAEAVSPEGVHPAGTQAGVFLVSDNTMNNTTALLKGSGTSAYAYAVTVGGGQQAVITHLASSTAGQLVKHAVAYRANDFAGSANGGTPGTDAAGTLPTVDRMHIGQSNTAGWWFNGWIRTLKFYPKRLPDSTLQRMTMQ